MNEIDMAENRRKEYRHNLRELRDKLAADLFARKIQPGISAQLLAGECIEGANIFVKELYRHPISEDE